jgi:hypothetical protein
MKNVKVEQQDGQGYVLFFDNERSFCPFQQPIPAQGIGGVTLMRMPCSTNCPLAEYKEMSKSFTIYCGAEIKKYDVSELNDNNQTPIISL